MDATEQQAVKLLITINGGLEYLAEKQVRSCFKDLVVELEWQTRNSGSQLYITLLRRPSIQTHIACAMNKLDYVEYIYVLIDSLKISIGNDNGKNSGANKDDEAISTLLQRVEKAAAQVSLSSLDFCTRICDIIGCNEFDSESGLQGLPGLLLPTPEITFSSCCNRSHPTAHFQDFDVNTIYTKDNVAKAIVQTISEFFQQHFRQIYNKNTLWVDAGSGNGVLLDNFPAQNCIGIDTCPTSPRVRQMDFFKLSRHWLNQEFPACHHLVVLSNPPFSLSNRGDYTPIIQFINHSLDILLVDVVAVICPSKFARQRIWRSLDMTKNAQLEARFFLPQDSFYNPSTMQTVHIHSYCLIFGNRRSKANNHVNGVKLLPRNGVYLYAKRDKGCFPNVSTVDLTKAIAFGLTKAGMELVSERNARYKLRAKLLDSSSMELWWNINSQNPCSLINSNSFKVPNHSLGWISLSVKPAIALAMTSIAMNNEENDGRKSCLVVNLMSGEGTIELEASRAVRHSFFMISGDKSFHRALNTAKRLRTLKRNGCYLPLIDNVAWDAQRLPLRRSIVDAVIADLPFQGSLNKRHQEPVVGKVEATLVDSPTSTPVNSSPSSVNYLQVLDGANDILLPTGRAALLSPDFKALRHACGEFHWSPLGHSKNVNLGGLVAKLFVMERRDACTKDLSFWISSSMTDDLSTWTLAMANKACKNTSLDLKQMSLSAPLVTNVQLLSTYFHPQKQSLSHCYRLWFNDRLRNVQVKKLEQEIRLAIKENMLSGISLR